jgi:hypothetical protein
MGRVRLPAGRQGWGWTELNTPHLNPPPQGGRRVFGAIFKVIFHDGDVTRKPWK